MNIIDISWPISPDMTAYKDRKQVLLTPTKTFEQDHVRESMLQLGCNSGTHIDAPSHFMRDGVFIDKVSLSTVIGPCTVLDLTHVTFAITASDLQKQSIDEGSIVVCKTTNSSLAPTAPFNPHFVYIDASAARYLVEKNIKAIGIDYLGIERNQPDHATHEAFMQAGITIIEGLRLQGVQAGNYFLWCLPLALQGTEAAPARAVLVQEK
ncbi:MAG TPA: cyclase family protein [Candidatus Limnocylindria bacterium]|nr:cyclase family protein [Candidatus Limnocylindria bacterium]